MTLAALKTIATRMTGVAITASKIGRHYEVLATCNPGRCFEPGLHELVEQAYSEDPPVTARRALAARLREYKDTQRCIDPICDWCI